MCPVRSVTYVSGRSKGLQRCRPLLLRVRLWPSVPRIFIEPTYRVQRLPLKRSQINGLLRIEVAMQPGKEPDGLQVDYLNACVNGFRLCSRFRPGDRLIRSDAAATELLPQRLDGGVEVHAGCRARRRSVVGRRRCRRERRPIRHPARVAAGTWFTTRAEPPAVQPGLIAADAIPSGAIGDSAVVDFLGLGAMTTRTADGDARPAFADILPDAVAAPRRLLAAAHPGFARVQPRMVIAARRAIESAQVPVVSLGVLDKAGKRGRLAGGFYRPPLDLFERSRHAA